MLATRSEMQLDICTAAVRMPTTEAATDRGSIMLHTGGTTFVEGQIDILLARLWIGKVGFLFHAPTDTAAATRPRVSSATILTARDT